MRIVTQAPQDTKRNNLFDPNPNLIYNDHAPPPIQPPQQLTTLPAAAAYQSTLRGPMRFFTTAGLVNCQIHYRVPPLQNERR